MNFICQLWQLHFYPGNIRLFRNNIMDKMPPNATEEQSAEGVFLSRSGHFPQATDVQNRQTEEKS